MCISRWQHEGDSNRGFDVSYMVWEEFFVAVMSPINHKELLEKLSSVDCVIGSVDINNPYGVTSGNITQYIENLREVCREVCIWPPQDQVNNIASKWQLIQSLDLIAGTRTLSSRPRTWLLCNGQPINNKTVLKRTHSNAAEHVLLLNDKTMQPKWDWGYLCSQMDIPGCQWMAQMYVETLEKRGKWRVFVIGGQIVYTVHTLRNHEKKTWLWDVVRTYYSLEELT
ncbi:hypothetical protein PILCRDRAFT_84468 [Piloderma croceum F 1598]|uniref:Uncharacterized protein n=1 Tax=Piloderma croceum (strain F 1598) TaxID=765440 RepID=A0A0C3GFL2_PILCF|nr:hypothetical protein PILCRDRAFT_84468 [Piloderma croceum F 1598]